MPLTPSEGFRAISLVGLGKLGAPIAAAAASRGCRVVGVDTDPSVVDLVDRGKPPVFEPGLADLLAAHRDRIGATQDIERAVLETQATFVTVPTPSDDRGAFSLRYVNDVCARIGDALRCKIAFHLVVLTSTVMPGATNQVRRLLEERSGKRCGIDFGLCYSPEFVALGSVVRGFLEPDFVLIGESDQIAGDKLEEFYRAVCTNRPPIARMSFVNAELAKLAVNTFVTTKISFANMLAEICEQTPGADVDTVTGALGLDSRIGPGYLRGSVGYGGPCFPRDNLALTIHAKAVGASPALTQATDAYNRLQVQRLTNVVRRHLPRDGAVGILGLAYKPNSNMIEQSQGLMLAEQLTDAGIPVVAFDPAAIEYAQRVLPRCSFASTAESCITAADVVAIVTPWDEFRGIAWEQLESSGRTRVVVDCWRMFANNRWCPGFIYVPLGVGPLEGED